MKVLVLLSTNGLNDAMFNTGCTYFPTSFIRRFGINRLTSNNENGLLKTVSSLTALLDIELDKQDVVVTSAAAFKSGLNGIYRLTKNSEITLGSFLSDSNLEKLSSNLVGDNFTVAGVSVKGFLVDIELRISNPYSVEFYKEGFKDTLVLSPLESAVMMAEKYSCIEPELSFRDSLMKQAITDSSFNMGAALVGLKVKSNLTRITHNEFQSVATWYGKEIAMEWLEVLSSHDLNALNPLKRSGHEWLTGNINCSFTLPLTTLKTVFTESMVSVKQAIKLKTNSYPTVVLKAIVEALSATRDNDWISLTVGDEICYVPTGELLYGKLYEEVEEVVVATGLLSFIMNTLRSACIFENAFIGDFLVTLKAKIQSYLLGKTYGYQHTVGKYFTMLPGAWLKNKYDICLPGRDHFIKSGKKFVKGNVAKMPTLFIGSISGVNVFKDIPDLDLDDELRSLLSCVVFVHPSMFLEQQNDADGDLCRISFERYQLPLYGTYSVADCFNSKFHEKYIKGEENPVLKGQKSKVVTFKQLHTNIKAASEAKMLVGSFTDAKFFYDYALSSIKSFVGSKNQVIDLTANDKTDISILLGELVQTEAMNNIKQSSNSAYVGSTISPLTLRNYKVDPETRIENAANSIAEYVCANNHSKSEKWCELVAEVLYRAANCTPACDLISFKVMKDSTHEKNIVASYSPTEGEQFCAIGLTLKPTSDMNFEIFKSTSSAYSSVECSTDIDWESLKDLF